MGDKIDLGRKPIELPAEATTINIRHIRNRSLDIESVPTTEFMLDYDSFADYFNILDKVDAGVNFVSCIHSYLLFYLFLM